MFVSNLQTATVLNDYLPISLRTRELRSCRRAKRYDRRIVCGRVACCRTLQGQWGGWVGELQLVGDANIYWSLSSSPAAAAAAAAALSRVRVDHEHKRTSAVDMATTTWVGAFSIEQRPVAFTGSLRHYSSILFVNSRK